MSRHEFFSLLPEGTDADEVKAQMKGAPGVSRNQHGPDPNVVKLPSGPTDIDVSLPPGSAVDDTSREGRHSSASVQISTIVFVHGVCSASALYQPIIQLSGVRDKYRVVTYDLEGHGLSPLNDESGDMDIEKWARTLGEVLDFVGVQRAVIVGHSVGGFIATSFAIAYPERVSKLFLISPANPMNSDDDKAAQWAAFLPLTLQQGVGPWTGYVQQFAFHPDTSLQRPLVKPFVEGISRLVPTQTMARCVIAMYAPTPDFKLLRLGEKDGVVALLLNGDHETGWPNGVLSERAVKMYREAFAGCETIIPGAGHYALLENSEAVALELTQFLGK